MREILFRGKTDKRKWVEGYIFEMQILGDKTTYISTKPFMLGSDGVFYYEPFAVDTETVGQYTGLIDKNGTKIFEGDIHEHCEHYFVIKYGKFKDCETNENGYGWYFENVKNGSCESLCGDEKDYANIIGNIHDNPELLKGGD